MLQIENQLQGLYYFQVGDPTKQNLVLLHPMWVFSNFYEPLIPFLTDHFYITVFDLPGFGKSPGLTDGYSVEAITDSVKNSLFDLNLKRPIIFGSSLGALVAMVLANDSQLDIIALALHAPPWNQKVIHLNFGQHLLELISRSDAVVALSNKLLREQKFVEIFVEMANLLKARFFVLEEKYHLVSETLNQVNLEICNKIWKALPEFEVTTYTNNIKVPTLLFISEKDGTVNPTSVIELAGFIQNAETKLLPQGGHALPAEYPNDVAKAFLKFCASHDLY